MTQERDYFADDIVVPDISPAVSEGDEAEMDAAQADIEAEPPPAAVVDAHVDDESRDDPADVAQRESYAKASALGGPLPTERPEDPTIMWSPRPGMVGCDAKGYRALR